MERDNCLTQPGKGNEGIAKEVGIQVYLDGGGGRKEGRSSGKNNPHSVSSYCAEPIDKIWGLMMGPVGRLGLKPLSRSDDLRYFSH